MANSVINFRTPMGRLYQVLKDGNLVVAGVPASGQWKFIGLKHARKNKAIYFKELTKEFLEDFEPCYESGNPQWTVIDNDHGTVRVWGNINNTMAN